MLDSYENLNRLLKDFLFVRAFSTPQFLYDSSTLHGYSRKHLAIHSVDNKSRLNELQLLPQNSLLEEGIAPLVVSNLPKLTTDYPHQKCRVSVVIPVRDEAENLPIVINALAQQVDDDGNSIDFDTFEVLVLANNCSDNTVEVARRLGCSYPMLRLHTIEVFLSRDDAFVGKARQMVMDEAYRRLSSIGTKNRIIASTDGDTEVAPDWINALVKEFDRGADAVGGRILTHRAAIPEIDKSISLYFLRLLGHGYVTSQIECLLDPQPHDGWPRHCQYYGANMAVLADVYRQVEGLPLVKDEEDVALYERLKRADAKIRHSLAVRVLTSARREGRATGGLAERLEELAYTSKQRQVVFVELPQITEARILIRQQLRHLWEALHQITQFPAPFNVRYYERTAVLSSRYLGLSPTCLRQEIEQAPTFGMLLETVIAHQRQNIDPIAFSGATMEISQATMHLRRRLQHIRQRVDATGKYVGPVDFYLLLQTLQQVQSIPLFCFA